MNILVVGLSISLDKVLFLPRIELNECNRATRVVTEVGGKSVNVSSVLRQLGEVPALVGVVAGRAGDFISRVLRERGVVADLVFQPGAETRTDYVLAETETGRSTLVTEPNFPIDAEVLREVERKVELRAASAQLTVFAGRLPPGVPLAFYASLVKSCRRAGSLTVVDSSAAELAETLPAGPDYVKPNLPELSELVGYRPGGVRDIVKACERVRRLGAGNVIVSMGSGGAVLVGKDGCLLARTPPVPAKNTVGCGDAMVAGFAAKLVAGASVDEAFRYSVAVGAAAAMSPGVSSIPVREVDVLFPQVLLQAVE